MIEEQISRTKRLIQREEDEFEERRRRHEGEHGQAEVPSKPARMDSLVENETAPREATIPEMKKEPEKKQEEHSKQKHSHPQDSAAKDTHGEHDESGDEVVDAEEDMVIY